MNLSGLQMDRGNVNLNQRGAAGLPFSTRDIEYSLGDYWLEAIGARKTMNPVAETLAAEGVGLEKLARHWAAPHDAEFARGTPKSEIIGRMLGSADFVSALTSGWHTVVAASFNESISGYKAILRDLPVRDFRPQSVPDFGGLSPLVKMTEHGEWKFGELTSSSVLESVGVDDYGLVFQVSRAALANDAAQEIAMLMAQLGNIAALMLAQATAEALEDTSALSDGVPYFDASKSNLLTGADAGAPSVSTMDGVNSSLWRRPVGDHVAGVAPRYIVVPPELAATTRVLLSAIADPAGTPGTLPPGRLDTVVLPHLQSTTAWYALGDPALAPALALLRLQGASQLVALENIRTPLHKDGLAFRLRTTFAVARISRVGAVKVEGSA